MISLGTFVHINGRVQKQRYKEELEFKIKKMDLLTELREKRTKTLLIEVESADLSDAKIDEL